MNDNLRQAADIYFQDVHGVSWQGMLAPVADSAPAGDPLAGTAFYQTLAEARRQDDASLPLGPWAHELKLADWPQLATLTAQAFAERSKDLQLAVWLLEAEIHRHGFAGVAPCLCLMEGLLDDFWDELYPQPDGADQEHRANLIEWVNQRLLPTLSLIPLTRTGWDRGEFVWADWQRAGRIEHLRLVGGEGGVEGASRSDLLASLAATATESHRLTHAELQLAVQAGESLQACIDRRFGDQAPSLSALVGLLGDIAELIAQELGRRNVGTTDTVETAVDQLPAGPLSPATDGPAASPLASRAQAYARLAEVAEQLMQLEPHSPVPYLVRRAVLWGQMDTRELYEQVFVRQGGQLNVFELVGANLNDPGEGGD